MYSETQALVLAASQNIHGNKIITFKLTYPRIIHAELLTHRVFSRNAASSRAIPIDKLIESVKQNLFMPTFFQKSHKGMQGTEILKSYADSNARIAWLEASESAIHHANKLKELGVTKQLVNRILEPFQYYTSILTGTDFENFFELRAPKYEYKGKVYRSKQSLLLDHPDFTLTANYEYDSFYNLNTSPAEIHIQELAELMYDAYHSVEFKVLAEGQLHSPYNNSNYDVETLLKVSTAKAARISYTVVGSGKGSTIEDDILLHDRLLKEGHASPFEHSAFAREDKYYSNFRGFQSYRNLLGI